MFILTNRMVEINLRFPREVFVEEGPKLHFYVHLNLAELCLLFLAYQRKAFLEKDQERVCSRANNIPF